MPGPSVAPTVDRMDDGPPPATPTQLAAYALTSGLTATVCSIRGGDLATWAGTGGTARTAAMITTAVAVVVAAGWHADTILDQIRHNWQTITGQQQLRRRG